MMLLRSQAKLSTLTTLDEKLVQMCINKLKKLSSKAVSHNQTIVHFLLTDGNATQSKHSMPHSVDITKKLSQEIAPSRQANIFPQNIRFFSTQIRLIGNTTWQYRDAVNTQHTQNQLQKQWLHQTREFIPGSFSFPFSREWQRAIPVENGNAISAVCGHWIGQEYALEQWSAVTAGHRALQAAEAAVVVVSLYCAWLHCSRWTLSGAWQDSGAVSYTHLTLPTNREV